MWMTVCEHFAIPDHPCITTIPGDHSGDVFRYPISRDGFVLVKEWRMTPTIYDRTCSGVLADYLEEHRDELLVGATGPSAPAPRLDALIQYLRSRFHSVV